MQLEVLRNSVRTRRMTGEEVDQGQGWMKRKGVRALVRDAHLNGIRVEGGESFGGREH